MLTPQEQQIDQALQQNLTALKDSVSDLLAAVILLVIAFFSILHGVLRVVFAGLGLLLWALALLNVWLYSLRAWAVSRSSSSLHDRSF